jgi:transposase-like protein
MNFQTESATGWRMLLENIKSRGVERIDLIISDALKGIEDSIATTYSSSVIQFCTVHLKRNILNSVKKADKTVIAEELKEIFKVDVPNDNVEKAWQRWLKFIEKYSKKYKKIGNMNNSRYYHYFTYLKYDYRIRSMINTSNWIERLNRNYRRTSRMREASPSVDATLALLGAVAMDRKAFNKKYLNLILIKNFDWFDDY